jgi:hypothetical protein
LRFNNISIFLLLSFSFSFSFSLFSFSSVFYIFLLTLGTQAGTEQRGAATPWPLYQRPHGAPPTLPPSCCRDPCPLRFPFSFPLSSLSGELSHGRLWSSKSGHGRLLWRALIKTVFLRGMTKTDAHDLPLAIPVLNFIQNEI